MRRGLPIDYSRMYTDVYKLRTPGDVVYDVCGCLLSLREVVCPMIFKIFQFHNDQSHHKQSGCLDGFLFLRRRLIHDEAEININKDIDGEIWEIKGKCPCHCSCEILHTYT